MEIGNLGNNLVKVLSVVWEMSQCGMLNRDGSVGISSILGQRGVVWSEDVFVG